MKCQERGRKLIQVINNGDIKIFSKKRIQDDTNFFSIFYE
jgi:hypothetical protein